MNSMNQKRRVLRALGNLCNESITASEGRWLAEQLHKDPTVRIMYIDYMTMHANLSTEATALRMDLPKSDSFDQLLSEATSEGGETQIRDAGKLTAPERKKSTVKSMLAIVASVALCVGAVSYLNKGDDRVQVTEDASKPDASYVARITGTQNCLWGDSDGEIGYGAKLHSNRTICLREGIAELTFEDGATLLLESPATVVLHAAGEIEMLEGRLAAVIPAGANHFSIHTKTLNLSNSNAEFGLWARNTGASELHVFNGTVDATILNENGRQRQQVEVNASEAVLASFANTTVREFAAEESHFVRSLSPTSGPHGGLLVYEGFVYPEGTLSAQNGGFGWAGPWSTLSADLGAESNSVRIRSLEAEGLVPRGNHAAIVAQRNRIRRSLASSIGGVFDSVGLVEDQNGVRLIGQDGSTIYLSFLQRVDILDDGFYGVELHRGDGNANRVLCIGNGVDQTGYGVTSAVNSYEPKHYPGLGKETTEVNFFVVKITFGIGNHDTVEVYRNPTSLEDEELCKVNVTLKGNFAFDRISLANYDGAKIHEVDELRVGTHFAAVAGRWGGERGRLLRGLTQRQPYKLNNLSSGRKITVTGNYRNSVLLASNFNALPSFHSDN